MASTPRILVLTISPVVSAAELAAPESGWDVREVPDLGEALRSAAERSPDLLVIQVRRADEHAQELCRRLKSEASTRSAPILLVSDDASERDLGPKCADALLVRPTSAVLRSTIRMLLRMRRVEDALRRANEKLQRTLDSISDGLLTLDRDWRNTYFSETGARMIGMRREDLIGRCIWDLFPDARGTRFEEGYRRAVETGRPVVFEEFYPEPLNKWFECHCYPSPEGLSVYFHDVTERRRAEDALRGRDAQLQALIENVSSGVALVDETGRFTLYNRQFLTLFGFSADSDIHNVNDQDWRAWRVFDESEQLLDVDDHPVRKAALTRRPVRNQLVGVLRPSGRELVWMLVSAEPLLRNDGTLEHLICTYHDVTERRHAEEQLEIANEQLRDADRRKNEFLAVLSHELRNPLAPIRNSVYVLEHAAPGGEQARRARQVIERQAAQLTRLVDDLLEVTRISQGKIRLQREILELGALARRCCEDHRQDFTETGVELRIELPASPVYVDGDPARLAQIVGNLLSNAAKFTGPGGHAVLHLETPDVEHAVIRVRDTGVGMAPDLLTRLFEPFVQGEATLDRTRGGLGLGLAVLKGLVELHGGAVSAQSEGHGKGSEFVVVLPTTRQTRERRSLERLRAPAEDARRVLVIEDNPDAAESLKTVLELRGHIVAVAHTGPEGIEKARTMQPHVVLCDIGLPGMDGFEVGRALRADPALSRTTLVALSGYALPEDVEKAREAGFDRHLAKPVDPSDLVGI